MKADGNRDRGEKNRQAVLAFVTEHIRTKQVVPSTREIAAAVGLTSNATVSRHLQRLEQEGHLKRVGRRAIALVGREGGELVGGS